MLLTHAMLMLLERRRLAVFLLRQIRSSKLWREKAHTHTLEADDTSSLGSADFGSDRAMSEHADEAGASEHADEAGASDHSEIPGDGGTAKHFDELAAVGFALAQSAALLPEFSTRAQSQNCIDAAWMKPMTGACTEADREALTSCMTTFFTRRPVLQSTPPREDKDHARILKSPAQIGEAWRLIFERRRLVEPDDRRSIEDPDQLAQMWTTWQKEWFAKELTPAQTKKNWREKTSIFNGWCWKTLGGKHFVMAVWQTGMTWAPTPELLNTNFNCALEHVATHFASWTRRLARSVARHKADPLTDEARTRSGFKYRQHGLTPQQVHDREERRIARVNYYKTVQLANKLHASKGKGKEKGRGATEHSVRPKYWEQMSGNERWWLCEYWNGHLGRAIADAEAECHRVQAPRFSVVEIS